MDPQTPPPPPPPTSPPPAPHKAPGGQPAGGTPTPRRLFDPATNMDVDSVHQAGTPTQPDTMDLS